MTTIRAIGTFVALITLVGSASAQESRDEAGARAAVRALIRQDPFLSSAFELNDVSQVKDEERCDTTRVVPHVADTNPFKELVKPYSLVNCGFKHNTNHVFVVENAKLFAADSAIVSVRYFFHSPPHGMIDQRRVYVISHGNGHWKEVRRVESPAHARAGIG